MNELHTTCYQVKIVGFIFSVLHKLEWIIFKKRFQCVWVQHCSLLVR